MNTIEIKGLSKWFGPVQALRNINLTLEENHIYGLLGRNGAGKSTLLNIITNRIFANEGQVLIGGMPAMENDKAQSLVYMMGEKTYHPDHMRVADVFKWTSFFYDGAFDMEYALSLADAFGLSVKKKVKQLSTGYGSIYKIITALSLDVPFLLLDEPVLGLDANHRELLYKTMLENYGKKPRTMVISTHLIEEIASLIEEVIIIKNGAIIKQASSEALLSEGYTITGPAAVVDSYIAEKEVLGCDLLGGLKSAYVMGKGPEEALPPNLELGRMDLQKLFIKMTNEDGRDAS